MKKFEILQELLKCDARQKTEQIQWKNGIQQTCSNLELYKLNLKENETTTKKHNKVKQNIMKYTCITKWNYKAW